MVVLLLLFLDIATTKSVNSDIAVTYPLRVIDVIEEIIPTVGTDYPDYLMFVGSASDLAAVVYNITDIRNDKQFITKNRDIMLLITYIYIAINILLILFYRFKGIFMQLNETTDVPNFTVGEALMEAQIIQQKKITRTTTI